LSISTTNAWRTSSCEWVLLLSLILCHRSRQQKP
jgi:hypothetical protein